MPIPIIRVEETIDSRTLRDGYDANQKYIELKFVAWNDQGEDLNPIDVEDAVLNVCLNDPLYGDPLFGLRLQTINLEPLARSVFIATVPYGVKEPPILNQIKIGFTTAGGVEHVTHSLATLGRYAATGFVAPDFQRAVNVTKDGVQGYQRLVPQLAFWVTAQFDPTLWNAAAWLNLNDLSCTWNLSSWHGWPAKYVLFVHAECPEATIGSRPPGSPELASVKFYFLARRPEAVNKGNGISFTKDPWDYVWDDTIVYADATAKALAVKIRSTHREQQFPGSDFNLLGMGS